MNTERQSKPSTGLFPLPLHFALGWGLVIVTLGLIGLWVPASEKTIGASYLIFFFHFPSAVNCLNIFLVTGIFSVLYLVKRSMRYDLLAASGIEVGLLATTVTLVTGSIWAKAAWGIWWDVSDPRLMSVAIMWLIYVGYQSLRGTIEDANRRAVFASVFGTIAALNVPVVLFAIRVLGKQHHPMNVVMAESSMVITRWFGAFSFLILYTAFWRLRYSVLKSADTTLRLEARLQQVGL